MKRAFQRTITHWFILAACVSIALAAGWYISLLKSTERVTWVEHTHNVVYRLRIVAALIDEAVVGIRGFDLTGEDRFLELYRRALTTIDAELGAIRILTDDNLSQQKRLAGLETLVAERLIRIKESVDDKKRGGKNAFVRLYLGEDGEKWRQRICGAVSEMEAEERRLLELRDRAATSSRQWSLAFCLVGTAVNLAIMIWVARSIGSETGQRDEIHQTLRQSQERFREIFDVATVGIGLVDPNGKWLEVNRSLCEILGYSKEELVATDSQRLAHPDDVAARHVESRRVLDGEISTYQKEKRYIHKRGHVLWIARSVSLIRDDAGLPLHFVILMEDVTARKKAQAGILRGELRYLSLVEATGAIVWNTPASGEFVSAQPAWTAFTGQSFDQLKGSGWLDAVHPDDRALTTRNWSAAVAGLSRFEIEHRLRRHDGEYRHMLGRAVPIRAEDQTIEEWVGVHIDIDVQKRAQVSMRDAKEAAEAASQAKSEFLANVSHEIRTPMNAILGMTDLTLDSELKPEQRVNLQIVRSAIDSLLSVINDLLDFSKMEAGKLELDPVEFSLREHVGDILALFGPRAHAKGLELACRIHPEVPDQLIGDPARLRQIVANLVGNAIKFTERGEVSVDVEAELRAGGNYRLHFRVTDTGIGIPADKQEVIFARFTQVDGSTTRLCGGTGLGLAIAAQLASLMGGRVWVESEVGRGSTFHFTAHLAPSQTASSTEDAAPVSLRGLRVLVVDDNAVNRRILEEMLAHWRMEPTLADGAQAALNHLERARDAGTPFALVLIDAKMPEMDGFTLAERIKADPEALESVLLMLTSPDRHEITRRIRGGATTACVHKPIHQFELKAAILAALGQKPRADQQPSPSDPPAPRPPVQALRILVAEDNLFNQRVASLMLAKIGHEATIAVNGRAALAALEHHSFDMVLMDLQMPVMDGFQATAAIRRAEAGTGRHVPIVALTAHAMKEDRVRCLEAGMDGYVSKPIEAVKLRQAIEDCAGWIRGHAEAVPDEVASVSPMDADAALARVGGDRGFLGEMAVKFLDESPRLLAQIREAVTAADSAGLAAPAHTLKNWTGNFVASKAFEAATDLEAMGRAQTLATAGTALATLEREIARLGAAMAQFNREPAPLGEERSSLAIAIDPASSTCTLQKTHAT